MKCTKCGSETKYTQGVGRHSGKAYEGYKCLNLQCNNLDFISNFSQTTPTPAYPPRPEQPKPSYPQNNRIKLLEIAADMAKATETPIDHLESIFREVVRIYKGEPKPHPIAQPVYDKFQPEQIHEPEEDLGF